MNVRWMINVTLLVSFLLLFGVAHAQQLPKSAAIGSNPPGSLFYALASGLAKVVSEASQMQAQVQPYAGTSTFVPLFDSSEPNAIPSAPSVACTTSSSSSPPGYWRVACSSFSATGIPSSRQ